MNQRPALAYHICVDESLYPGVEVSVKVAGILQGWHWVPQFSATSKPSRWIQVEGAGTASCCSAFSTATCLETIMHQCDAEASNRVCVHLCTDRLVSLGLICIMAVLVLRESPESQTRHMAMQIPPRASQDPTMMSCRQLSLLLQGDSAVYMEYVDHGPFEDDP